MYRNGILIQGKNKLNKIIIDKEPENWYCGMHRFYDDPLLHVSDVECIDIQRERMFELADTNPEICNQFISNLSLAKRYISKCIELQLDVRVLFIESQYPYEIWNDEIPELVCLGYEVTEIPLGIMTLYDLFYDPRFEQYKNQLNEHGLFSNEIDAHNFMNTYKPLLELGVVGDGNVDLYVCRVYEVQSKDLLT